MILNTVLGLMEYKSLVQMFNNPVTLGSKQKNRFSACFEKYSAHSVLRWSFQFQRENKKRNFAGNTRSVQNSVCTSINIQSTNEARSQKSIPCEWTSFPHDRQGIQCCCSSGDDLESGSSSCRYCCKNPYS